MNIGSHYGTKFFEQQMMGSIKSAQRVVPLLCDLIQPASVVDVGCGVGGWLRMFQESGVRRVCGYDGSHVDRAHLQVPEDCFVEHDLTKPIRSDISYDLAISLEVGEHLPDKCARQFVESITNLSDVVWFSAAVPGQEGVYHINEQWQSYWVQHFAAFGYQPLDLIRSQIWSDPDVQLWYRQNALLYVRTGFEPLTDGLTQAIARDCGVVDVVHPDFYLKRSNPKAIPLEKIGTKRILTRLPSLLLNALTGRIKGTT